MPSCTRSANGTPRPRWWRATATTSRAEPSTRRSRAAASPRAARRARALLFLACRGRAPQRATERRAERFIPAGHRTARHAGGRYVRALLRATRTPMGLSRVTSGEIADNRRDGRSDTRVRHGRRPGRRRPRRSSGAACADGAGVPRADRQRAAPSAVPPRGVVVHALAGAPRRARSARGVATRQAAGWRAVNEGLLRDGCETIALLGGVPGEPSAQAVRLWLDFGARPTGRNWYRAHNASIVAGYLEHRGLAEAETEPRALLHERRPRARALRACAWRRRRAWRSGRSPPLGRVLGDPRIGMAASSCRCAPC